MVTRNSQFLKFDGKSGDQILKQIIIVIHKLRRNLFAQSFSNEFGWLFKVLKHQDKHFFLVPWNLNQINFTWNFMEITIQYCSLRLNSQFVIANIQWWRPFLCYDIDWLGSLWWDNSRRCNTSTLWLLCKPLLWGLTFSTLSLTWLSLLESVEVLDIHKFFVGCESFLDHGQLDWRLSFRWYRHTFINWWQLKWILHHLRVNTLLI